MAFHRSALFALLVLPLVRCMQLVSDEAEGRAAEGVDDVSTQCPIWCQASKQQWHVKCTYSRCSTCAMCGPLEGSKELQGLLEALPEAEPQGLLGGRAAEAGTVTEVAAQKTCLLTCTASDCESPSCATCEFCGRRQEAALEAEPQGLLGGRVAEAGAVAEVAAQLTCATTCSASTCESPSCTTCPFCARREAALEAEPQGLLGGRAAEAGAVAEVDAQLTCGTTCSASTCESPSCTTCPFCARREAALEAEPQGLLGGRAAEAGAIAEVATQRSNESDAGVASEGVEDSKQCPIWCHVSKQYWNVKCTYMRCSTCAMCGPPASKEAAPEAEPQGLLGGRAAEAGAIAEVAAQLTCATTCSASTCESPSCTTCPFCARREAALEAEPQGLLGGRAAEAGTVAEVAAQLTCGTTCSASTCESPSCTTCPFCARKEAALEAEPQGLLGGRAAEVGAVAEVATQQSNESDAAVASEGVEDSKQCPIWCHVSKQYWNVKCSYMRCSTCPMCGTRVG